MVSSTTSTGLSGQSTASRNVQSCVYWGDIGGLATHVPRAIAIDEHAHDRHIVIEDSQRLVVLAQFRFAPRTEDYPLCARLLQRYSPRRDSGRIRE